MQNFLLIRREKMVRLTMGIHGLGINEKLANRELYVGLQPIILRFPELGVAVYLLQACHES